MVAHHLASGASIRTDFNSNFYVAAALVIPIYFLALMFPEGILFKYWEGIERWHDRKDDSNAKPAFSIRRLGKHVAYLFSLLPPLYLIASGGIAETIALIALNNRNASVFQHAMVLAFFIPVPAATALCIMITVALRSMDKS